MKPSRRTQQAVIAQWLRVEGGCGEGLTLAAIARGTREAAQLPEFDDFLVDGCRIDLNRPRTTIGLDGELKRMTTPLDYRIDRDALRLVVAPPEDGE